MDTPSKIYTYSLRRNLICHPNLKPSLVAASPFAILHKHPNIDLAFTAFKKQLPSLTASSSPLALLSGKSSQNGWRRLEHEKVLAPRSPG